MTLPDEFFDLVSDQDNLQEDANQTEFEFEFYRRVLERNGRHVDVLRRLVEILARRGAPGPRDDLHAHDVVVAGRANCVAEALELEDALARHRAAVAGGGAEGVARDPGHQVGADDAVDHELHALRGLALAVVGVRRGAARVALGTELPALFCNDDAVAADLLAQGETVSDPLWRLPLHRPYRKMLDSQVADINNVSEGGTAGAITAALYLQEFVERSTPWVHLDIMAWNTAAKPGRPAGGEAMAMRALFALIESRFTGRTRARRRK